MGFYLNKLRNHLIFFCLCPLVISIMTIKLVIFLFLLSSIHLQAVYTASLAQTDDQTNGTLNPTPANTDEQGDTNDVDTTGSSKQTSSKQNSVKVQGVKASNLTSKKTTGKVSHNVTSSAVIPDKIDISRPTDDEAPDFEPVDAKKQDSLAMSTLATSTPATSTLATTTTSTLATTTTSTPATSTLATTTTSTPATSTLSTLATTTTSTLPTSSLATTTPATSTLATSTLAALVTTTSTIAATLHSKKSDGKDQNYVLTAPAKTDEEVPKAHEGGEGEPQQAVSQEDNGKEYHQDKEEYNLEQETDMTDAHTKTTKYQENPIPKVDQGFGLFFYSIITLCLFFFGYVIYHSKRKIRASLFSSNRRRQTGARWRNSGGAKYQPLEQSVSFNRSSYD